MACEEEGSDRDPVVVKLDPETRTFIFDGEPMEVLSVTKGYVAAFAHGQVRRDGLGGTVFIIKRATGEFMRLSYTAFCLPTDDGACLGDEMVAAQASGRCFNAF